METKKKFDLKKNIPRFIMLGVGTALLLAIGIIGLVLLTAKDDMVDQTLFLRWSEAGDYAQNSMFFNPAQKVTDKDIRLFRHEIETAYAGKGELHTFPTETERGDMRDAYSAFAPITLKGDHGQLTVDAIGVGGDFFLFHPIEMEYGNYFDEDDLMQDYVILDEESAWQLFGSMDVAGRRVDAGDKEYYVLGIYKRKQGELESLAAGNADPKIFVTYKVLQEQKPETPITCYELLSPNPIPHFARNILADIKVFSEDNYILLENSTRFSYVRYYDLLKARKSREMRTDNIAFPYWENLARYQEGRLMYAAFIQWNCAVILFILVFVNLLVFMLKHKPTREGLESALDVIKRKRRAKHMERLMKEDE